MSINSIDLRFARKRNLEMAEKNGIIADSMEVRMAIVARVESGEITPDQGQKELAAIKRNAKKNGKITRNQAYLGRTP